MKTTRRARPPLHRVCTAWLAAWLVVFAALAPLVSHALALGTASPTLEICTATGPQTLALPGADASVAPDTAADTAPVPAGDHRLAHCPFCLLHADRLALPSQVPLWVAPLLLAVRVAASTCLVAAPEPLYNSATPRGPPAHS